MATASKGWNGSDLLKVFGIGAVILVVIGVLASHDGEKERGETPPVPLSQTSYLCDLSSYRQRMLDDAIFDVREHSGDKFDEEAARKRVLSKSVATLESERQADLAFARKTFQDAHDFRELCPAR